jgi:hypothetical protein
VLDEFLKSRDQLRFAIRRQTTARLALKRQLQTVFSSQYPEQVLADFNVNGG